MQSAYSDHRQDLSYERRLSAGLFDDDYLRRQTVEATPYPTDSMGYTNSGTYPGWEEIPPELGQAEWNQGAYEPQEVDGNEVLEFSQFIMIPPKPGVPEPVLREKPFGCKTVFIGGIPPNAIEEMIVELMTTCGTVEQVRSKQRFAHVRFADLEAVDKAVFYAGWKIRVDGKDDNANCCRIHVDYAQARDDQREYEILENERAREFRNQKRLERSLNKSPTPPPAFNVHDSKEVAETLKGSADSIQFSKAANTLSFWLTKGMVNSRSATQIYSCLSAANSAARRISQERGDAETGLLEYKEQYRAKLSVIMGQVSTVEALFEKAKQQKVRDHFSKSQRKILDSWANSVEDIKCQLCVVVKDEDDDEMDFSDSDAPSDVKRVKSEPIDNEDSSGLRTQVEALQNEMEQQRFEKQNQLYENSLQIQTLEKALRASQHTLLDKAKQIEDLKKQVSKLSTRAKEGGSPSDTSKDDNTEKVSAGAAINKTDAAVNKVDAAVNKADAAVNKEYAAVNKPDADTIEVECTDGDKSEEAPAGESVVVDTAADDSEVSMLITEDGEDDTSTVSDARKVAVVSCFLLSHPHGVKFNAIKTYMVEHVSGCKASHVTELLKKYPNIFSLTDTKWKLTAFHRNSS